MFYVNFEEHITKKYMIILEGWPLKKLCAPGSINSQPELRILFNAFTSGAARFRLLSDADFDHWHKKGLPGIFGLHGPWVFKTAAEDAAEMQAASSSASSATVPGSSTAADTGTTTNDSGAPSAPPTPQPIPQSPIAAPTSETFVFSANGADAQQVPKKRKERSDKGKKRGPNARSKKAKAT